MLDWLASNPWSLWLLAAAVLAVSEMLTLDLTLLMLASGALAAAGVALFLPGLLWAQVAAAIVVAIHVVFAILLDMDYTGVSIRWLDKASLILLGLIIAAVICLPTQARLRVGPRGVGVKNWTSERVFR